MISNNDVLKKLRVALELRDDDIIKILKLADFEIGKTELSAFFRSEDHPNYKLCGDQVLRNFLNGLVIYKRGQGQNLKTDDRNSNPDFSCFLTVLEFLKILKTNKACNISSVLCPFFISYFPYFFRELINLRIGSSLMREIAAI